MIRMSEPGHCRNAPPPLGSLAGNCVRDRRKFNQGAAQSAWRRTASAPFSVAAHDLDGLLFAVTRRDRYGLRGAARHIGSFGRCDGRRIAMDPIPGYIVCIGVVDIAEGLRRADGGFVIRWPVRGIPYCGPEGPRMDSVVMPERWSDARTGNRTRRSNPCTRRHSGASECLVRGKHERDSTERRDQRPIHSIRHGTHQFVGYRAAPRTLGPVPCAGKRIPNY